jgi:hypothetical protein
MLDSCRRQALELYGRLAADPRYVTAFPPELDIVVWAARDSYLAGASAAARREFEEAAARGVHLALAELPARFFYPKSETLEGDATVRCLRSVVMKPNSILV